MKLLFRCASGVVATFLTLQFVACASDQATSAMAAPGATSVSDDGGHASSSAAKITSVEVGPEGKTFETESGMTVTIPPGALPEGTTITVKSGDEAAPTGFQAETGVFRFGPDGLVFATPITVSLPSTSTTGAVYWSRQDDPSMYDALQTTFENGHATAHPVHFSSAFVGKATEPVSTPDGKDAATDPGGDDAGPTPTDTDGGTPAPPKDGGTPADPKDGGTATADAGTTPPSQPLHCSVATRVMNKACPEKGCVCDLVKSDEPALTAQFLRWFGDPQGAIYVNSPTLNALYQTAASGNTFVADDKGQTHYAAPKGYSGYLVRDQSFVELHEDYVLPAKDGDGCGGVPQMIVSCSGRGMITPTGED